jgi:hypothetical protein
MRRWLTVVLIGLALSVSYLLSLMTVLYLKVQLATSKLEKHRRRESNRRPALMTVLTCK